MLTNSNVGIIGFGKIGKQIQLLLKPFKCKITIYDPKIRKFSSIRNLNFILKNSEIITLNIPFNKKNKNFINAQKLKQMSKNTILVNCSRGGLIDEKALHKKLKKNKNFKVVLDCFDVEPYYGELIKLENAILSPHVASYTKETRDKMEKNSFISCLKNINFKKLNE
jgi:D-3-phosphoglycerate dehydrogenase